MAKKKAQTPEEMTAIARQCAADANEAFDLDYLLTFFGERMKKACLDDAEKWDGRLAESFLDSLTKAIESNDHRRAVVYGLRLGNLLGRMDGKILEADDDARKQVLQTRAAEARASRSQNTLERHIAIRSKYREFRPDCKNKTAARKKVFDWATESDKAIETFPVEGVVPMNWGLRMIEAATLKEN